MSEATRMPLVERDQAGLLIRGVYGDDGSASNITKTLANSPDTLAKLTPLLGQVMNPTTIDGGIKELVVLRVSAMNHCSYCVPTHEVVARRMGIEDDRVACLASGDAGDGLFDDRSRAVIDLCDQLVTDAGGMTGELLARLRTHFEEQEIVELTVLAGAITLLNYVASAFDVPLDAKTLAATA